MPERIGGEEKIVEINEGLVAKRKYNCGRIKQGIVWVFGGVVRGETNYCFIEFVPDRKKKILLEVIRRRILPGTTISSDC